MSWPGSDVERSSRIYAFYCTVCEEILSSETCPKCPDTLLLRVYKDLDEEYPRWRTLA